MVSPSRRVADMLSFAVATANKRRLWSIQNIAKQVRQEIERLTKVLHLLGGTTRSKRLTVARKRRTMSAEARKRMGAAQRARWAKLNRHGVERSFRLPAHRVNFLHYLHSPLDRG